MVEQSVNVRRTFWCAVNLGDIKVFVERNADGDVGEDHDFGDGYLRDDNVHKGQSVKLPVLAIVSNEATRFFAACNA